MKNPEIQLFSSFIQEKYGEDSLSFFIYLRHIVETELSILLHPKFAGMKLQHST